MITRLRSLWQNLVHRRRMEEALDDELRAYVDLLATDYERRGLPAADARRAALIASGGMTQVKESTRDAWAGAALESVARELKYALRALRRAPAFVTISIAVLAIGLGGATAVYTVIKASLLRPLPGVEEPDRLITIERTERGAPIAELSYPDYLDIASQATTLSGVAGFNGGSWLVEEGGQSEREWISFVTPDFFEVLQVRPTAGTVFTRATLRDPADVFVVVLAHALWTSRFGASPDIVGKSLMIDGTAFTVIGVAPPGFVGGMLTHQMELFIPVTSGGVVSPVLAGLDLSSRRPGPLRLVGRLAPGADMGAARRELSMIAGRLATQYPETNRDRDLRALPRAGMTDDERALMARVPRLLSVAVALLILIACGNVAGLSLVRAAARSREFAARIALGASRGALIRQVVVEGALIATGATIAGIGIGLLLMRSAALVGTIVAMEGLDLSLDVRVLGIAIAAAFVTATLVSILPAIQVGRVAPGAILKEGRSVMSGSARGQRMLVVVQVAMAVVMLSAAGMIFTAFRHVLGSHAVHAPAGIADARISAERALPDTVRRSAFFDEVLRQAAGHPAVSDAALATTVPPFQWSGGAYVFRRGEEPAAGSPEVLSRGTRVSAIQVSETFFHTMRIPLVAGRVFSSQDTNDSEGVTIVSRRLASLLWPDGSALGREIAWPPVEGKPRLPLRVVGVAENTKEASLASEPPLAMYLPLSQRPAASLMLILRSRDSQAVTQPVIQSLVESINPDVVVRSGRTLASRLRDEVRPQQIGAAWVGAFGVIALILTAVGLYGVVAQNVLQRTRELAVRAAVGATPSQILAGVLGGGMRMAAIGVVIGIGGSFVAVRILGQSFSGIDAVDVRPQLLAMVVLGVATLAACTIPARRAARLNPSDALRTD